MKVIIADGKGKLNIGRQTDNERTTVVFPLADLLEEFPGGAASLKIRRPHENEFYVSETTAMDGANLLWVVQDYDVAIEGDGEVQLYYTVDDVAAPGRIFKTHSDRSLTDQAAALPGWSSWKDELIAAGNAILSAILAYNSMTAVATGLEPGDTPTAEIIDNVLHLGLVPGNDGLDAPQIDDTQFSHDNPWSGYKTGQYVDGVYKMVRSPVRPILDVTLEEDAALIVTEIDGESLSVDELHMVVKCPTGVEISAGSAFVYSGNTSLGEAYHVARTSSDTGVYWFASFKKDGGVWASKMSRTISSGSLVQVWEYFVSDLVNERYARSCITYPHITKLQLPAFPAGTRIVLYAR